MPLKLPVEIRNQDFPFHVDAGFINRRKCMTWLGQRNLDQFFEKYKESGTDHFVQLRNDHMLIEICIAHATGRKISSVREALINEFQEGHVYCGTEGFSPIPNVYEANRVETKLLIETESTWDVFLEFGTKNIFSDTLRMLLHEGAHESFLAYASSVDPESKKIILHPLFIGAPYFGHRADDDIAQKLMWHTREFYRVHAEDIEEFKKSADVTIGNEWIDVMSRIPEETIKRAFASILGDFSKKDWGGEFDDHYTSGVHIGARRYEASFLLKGPSLFREMVPAHLGKNGDQIYRISCTPADLLVVQHCHVIGHAVRATLHAFAYNPAHPRRYCLIDGKDTFKILKAYGKLPI